MTIASFAPTAAVNLQVLTSSKSVELPSTGSPVAAVVTNLGEQIVFIALGDDTVDALAQISMAVLPRGSIALTLGANTYIAAVALAGVSQINIAVGS